MTGRGRMRAGVIAAVGVGVAGVGFVGFKTLGRGHGRPAAVAREATQVGESSPLPDLARAAARGDGMALAVLQHRIGKKAGPVAAAPLSEAEVEQWTEALAGVRSGFARFSAYGRGAAVVIASDLLHRLQDTPAPANWRLVLKPSAQILGAALADQVWEVRVTTISEIKGLWGWSPSCNQSVDDNAWIGDWKEDLHPIVVERLGDRDPRPRTAAVACLGALPTKAGAEPAVQLLHDPDAGVRAQVMMSFCERPTLLTEEAILPLLHDPEPAIPPIARRVLKARGLTEEQVGMGSLVAHPRADMRASAIPFLKDHADLDPVVWLVYLSHDPEESVRAKALDELARRDSPDAKKRLAEMATSDTSATLRRKAEKLINAPEATAELPPLPPTPGSLRIKAN